MSEEDGKRLLAGSAARYLLPAADREAIEDFDSRYEAGMTDLADKFGGSEHIPKSERDELVHSLFENDPRAGKAMQNLFRISDQIEHSGAG